MSNTQNPSLVSSGDITTALGYTPENVANKSTSVTTDGTSDTKYPSAKAVKDYADGLVVGLLDDRGNFDASVNTFPASGGSGTAGAILKGDLWYISVAGTLGGVDVITGDTIRALTDTPGQTASNWDILSTKVVSGGSAEILPLADYSGSAIIGALGTFVFDDSRTLSKCTITADSIPVGSNLIVELRKNSYTSGNILSSTLQVATTDTLTNGKKTVSVTGFSTATVVSGDYVVAYLTSVGSTTPALNPVANITFS